MDLPTGTVTFLLTDVEGSTRLWEEHPDEMPRALARHDAIAPDAIGRHGGLLIKERGEGDSLFAVFPRATDAVAASCALQRAFGAEAWPPATPLRARMALHTGEAELRDGDYYGSVVNRCARLRAVGHGGQVLLSAATRELVRDALPEGASLKDMGSHRLRDLARPEHVFQLIHPDLPHDFAPLKSLDALPNNLPIQVTSFVGRENEVVQARRLLETTRLLTLTGPGGCGKTRLALQVAAEVLDGYPDGAWLVELAPLTDPALVPQVVASVLAVKEQAGRPLAQALADAVGPKRLLLVLDNCEHLLDACAQLAEQLMGSCPGVSLVATSREPLRVAGETTYRIPSLSVPEPGQTAAPESLSQYDAVRLFIDRALAVMPTFSVSNRNAPAVAQVCCRLGGIPLAIELAAARVRSLTVEEIASRLNDRFHLLTGGSRTSLPRQRTLQAALDWSYDLLDAGERVLLRRASVFAGAWTLEATERVCADDRLPQWQVLDLLTSLVDKSLVIFDETETGEGCYRMLETVREYAWKHLTGAGEGDAIRERHLALFMALAEEAEPSLLGPEQGVWLRRLEAQHDDLRAALRFSLEREPAETGSEHGGAQARETALRMAAALSRFWWTRGHLAEGRAWLDAALAHEGAPAATKPRWKALQASGVLAWMQGDCPAARSLEEASLAAAREIGDRASVAVSLDNLGLVVSAQGDYGSARALHEEALAIRRETNDRRGVAASLHNLWTVEFRQGDYVSARACLEEALSINRAVGNRAYEANNLIGLGNVAYQQGDCDGARALFEEGLSILRALGDRHGIASSLLNLGNVAFEQADHASARAFYEECLSILRDIGGTASIVHPLINLGILSAEQGECAAARTYLEECTVTAQELGNRHAICESLEAWAFLAKALAQMEHAARLLGAAQRLRDAIDAPLGPKDREQLQRKADQVRSALGDTAFEAALAEGRGMDMEQATEYALRGAVPAG